MALNGGEFVSAADSTFGMSGPMCAIWFGILVVKMAEFCLITPPIGLNCFVVAGVRDDLSVQDVFRGVTPFFIADALTIAMLWWHNPALCSGCHHSLSDRCLRFAGLGLAGLARQDSRPRKLMGSFQAAGRDQVQTA